jgi:NADPH-dependent 2,4-dienoyl-CoA reductase/sulfur reductase-like enzyme
LSSSVAWSVATSAPALAVLRGRRVTVLPHLSCVLRVTYKDQRLQPLHRLPFPISSLVNMALPPHVLIIGGGLAGPALAIALARRNIRSSIYELRSEPGDIGGALMLAPNALRVLDKVVGVYESVRSSGYVLQRVTAYASDGMKLGEIRLGEEKEDGYPAVRIRRPTLHRVLLEECARHGVTIQYGKKLERIEETGDGVTAFFADGTSATGEPPPPSACADIRGHPCWGRRDPLKG